MLFWTEINSRLNKKGGEIACERITEDEWMNHFIEVLKSDTVCSDADQLPGGETICGDEVRSAIRA